MKTTNTIRYFAVLLLAACTTVGCSIDPNINISPNAPQQNNLGTTQGVYALLVGTQTLGGDFYASDRSRVGAMWSWQIGAPPGLGRAQPEAWMTYTLDPTGPPDDTWKDAYKVYRNANDVRTYAPLVTFAADAAGNAATQATIIGISQFYKAMLLGEVAALFGSVPIHISIVDPPAFVSQAEAYAEVQRLLDSALTNMTAAGTKSVKFGQDLNFGGDASKWIAPIHSMKARYFLHVHDYASALAESKLGIAGASNDVFTPYSSTVGETSPWGYWVNVELNLRAEKAFVDSLKSEPGDKRLSQYFNPNSNGHIVGYAGHGEHVSATALDSESLDPNLSSTIKQYGANDAAFPVITYEENVLIRAEAEAQTGDLAGAVADVNIIRTAAGLPAFASTDAAGTLVQVLKQKWLQLFLEGQSYHDMRRTKTMFEVVPHTSNAAPGNLRFIYPQSETVANPNVPPNDDALVKPLSGY